MIFIFRKWIKLQANLSVNKDCVDMANKKGKKDKPNTKSLLCYCDCKLTQTTDIIIKSFI